MTATSNARTNLKSDSSKVKTRDINWGREDAWQHHWVCTASATCWAVVTTWQELTICPVLFCSVLFCSVLFCVMTCCAVSCHVVLCHVMFCCVTSCCAV